MTQSPQEQMCELLKSWGLRNHVCCSANSAHALQAACSPRFGLHIGKALHVQVTFGGRRYFTIKVHITNGCGFPFVFPPIRCMSMTCTPVYKAFLPVDVPGFLRSRKLVGCSWLFQTMVGVLDGFSVRLLLTWAQSECPLMRLQKKAL